MCTVLVKYVISHVYDITMPVISLGREVLMSTKSRTQEIIPDPKEITAPGVSRGVELVCACVRSAVVAKHFGRRDAGSLLELPRQQRHWCLLRPSHGSAVVWQPCANLKGLKLQSTVSKACSWFGLGLLE